ncbi:MAG: sugar phosphate nucleotidyltransferase, partial [Candidatus Thermoplasmatota archaeon]|nr:sugar phosphate nucleotidyltransferase [Candidatus Thermoplasmatota archaeon]
ITACKKAGVKDFIIVVGYRGEQVREYFGDGKKLNVKIEYAEQKKQLGTANALKQAEKFVKDSFLCLSPDSLISSQVLKKLCKQKPLTICIKEVPCAKELGVVKVRGNKILEISEKVEEGKALVNLGTYLLDPVIFDAIRKTQLSERYEYELTEALNILIREGHRLTAQKIKEVWLDIATPISLLKANELVLKNLRGECKGEVERYATLKGNVSVGSGTIITSGSYIIGPVIIGKNCEIGPNCFIRPFSSIGNNVRIGNGVEIKNSIIMDNTKIGHLSYVGDSIIGRNCNFGAGTVIANLRFDRKNVPIIIRGEKADSGLKKLGVIMGDNVQTGINVSIDPGTVICENATILPHAFVSGWIKQNSCVG